MPTTTEDPGAQSASLWTGEIGRAWLRELVDRGMLEPCRALLPSASMIEESLALSRLGFHVIVTDPDREALDRIQRAAKEAETSVDTVQGDVFGIRPGFFGPVELIYDRTLYHELDPIRRSAWAHATGRILPRDGHLVGLLLVGRSRHGPPYPVTLSDLRKTVDRLFRVETLESAGSHRPGSDHAYRMYLIRK